MVLFGTPGSIFQDTLHVEISQEGDVHVFNYAFPLSGEGCSDQASSIAGFRQNELRVYRNPVRDHFVIEGLSAKMDSTYEVFDLSGKRVFEGQLSNRNHSQLPTELPQGSYQLIFKNGIQ